MRDEDTGLILTLVFLWLIYKREDVTTTLYQTCRYIDGFEMQVPLGDACPRLTDHGGDGTVV